MPSRTSTLLAAAVVGVGLLGALIGLLVAGSVRAAAGPFDTDLSLRPSWSGGTVVEVPPLGELQLDTHSGPVQLDVQVDSLRPDAARAIVADPASLRGLGADVQSDLEAGLLRLLLRAVLVTTTGAALLGALVFRRRWKHALSCVGVGVGALLVVGAVGAGTYDDKALAQPRFTGLLATAPAAVGDVRDLVERFDRYQLQLGRLVSNVSQLYSTTSRLPVFTPSDDTVRVLHVSDLHLNPAAYEVIGSVVQQFGIDVVVDTGDITDFGSEPETRYVAGIAGLQVPYVYVRGNHDSLATQAAVAAQPGAVVLDGPDVVTVAGVRFLGMGDPRFTPDKTTRDDDAPAEEMLAVGRSLASAVRTAFEPPDVVAVHDPVTARPLLGDVPLVLAGHTHQRKDVREDGTLLMIEGSTGGAGLRALEGEQPTPISLTVLYLDPQTRALQAYDDITLGGLGANDARIRRTVVGQVLDTPQETPSPSPSDATPTPTPTPTETVAPGAFPTVVPARAVPSPAPTP